MRVLSTAVRTASIAALATLVLGLVAVFPASAELTVKGDAAAWRDVVAAYQKLSALPGYRIRTTMPQGRMVVEVAPSDKAMHSTVESSSGGAEFIIVGGQSRMRISASGAPAGWRCVNIPQMPNLSDPNAVQGTVDVTRAPDATIDGQPMHVYLYTIEGSGGGPMAAAGPVKTTLYVGGDNGLPRRVVVATAHGDQALDYYDYGAAIQITLPPCAPGS